MAHSGTRPLILLVEDHDDTRQMYAEFMGEDFEVLEASTGRDALTLMFERQPQVVVTDLSLPDIDGFELLRRIRAEPAFQRTPVICLSGYGGFANEDRTKAAAFSRLLQKPCLPDTLAGAVAEVLGSAPQP
jgi:two-component system CheB/CheR fusion protein